MRVALVYDRVNKWGGAESVLLALHEIFPNAPLYTSVYDKKLTPWADVFDVRTSFLQKTLLPKNKHEYYPFLMGIAFETFNFDEFDVVISVTHEFAKAIVTKPKTLHICYCLTPTSYLWSGYQQYFSSRSSLFKELTKPMIGYLRWYDKIICHRPDKYIAISKTVQDRIKRFYGLPSEVIYPPVSPSQGVAMQTSSLKPDHQYYLVVSRLVPNKRIDIVVKAFNRLNLPLKIVGTGTEKMKLKSLAKSNIEFLGYVHDADLTQHYANCTALIVPGVEDFGIVSVEAQSYGKPVIAFATGGSKETIIADKTGLFFDAQTPESLYKKIKSAHLSKILSKDCKANAQRFSKDKFKRDFSNFVEKSINDYNRLAENSKR